MGESKTLMVFHEKNGDEFYVAESDEDMNRIALKVLRQRYEDTLYAPYPTREEIQEDREDEINRLNRNTDGSVFALKESGEDFSKYFSDKDKEKLEKDKDKYDRIMENIESDYIEQIAFLDRLEELLSMPEEDALAKTIMVRGKYEIPLAYLLLQNRRDHGHEYEHFSIEETLEY